ncbi:hypothetical protein [Methanocaldococcus infernus]|nr:hypothetical protein [Methanocaldococcus infernus]
MLCMIGALVAEPVALGDISWAATWVVNNIMHNSVSGDAQYDTIVTSTGALAAYGFKNGIRFAVRGVVIGASAGPEGAIAGAVLGFAAGVA